MLLEVLLGKVIDGHRNDCCRGGKLVHGDLLVAIDDGDKVKDVSMCSARIVGVLLGPKAGNEIKLTFRGATPPNMPADVIAFRRGDPAMAELA